MRLEHEYQIKHTLLSNRSLLFNDFYLITSNRPVLSTGLCSAQIGRRSGGYTSKRIVMLYALKKKK